MSEENIMTTIAILVVTVVIANPFTTYCIYRLLTFIRRKMIKENSPFRKHNVLLSLIINVIIILFSMIVFWITNPLENVIYNIIITVVYICFIAYSIMPVSLFTCMFKHESK